MMAILHGVIQDPFGKPTAALVHILDPGGRPLFPEDSVRKRGPGPEGFYSTGEFSVETPLGYVTFLISKGIEYRPIKRTMHIGSGKSTLVKFSLERWVNLVEDGWYAGNTHVHYDQDEKEADARLRLDPIVHDLHFLAISHLHRWDLDYATNQYPVGVLEDFSNEGQVVCCGQENRHNEDDWTVGYGHILLLKLKQPVLPLSRGLLVNEQAPDYPPLSMDFDRTKAQNGFNIWCHNGMGRETPVAAILGKIDVMNLFDPYMFSEDKYQVWYDLLNCGIRLPASTGSDWFICSNNRVYVQMDGEFSHDAWLEGLAAGNTFITNGPVLSLLANEKPPGSEQWIAPDEELDIHLQWDWHQPLERIEIIFNGDILHTCQINAEILQENCQLTFIPRTDGWLAARAFSSERDFYYQPAFAHTSPLWVNTGISSSACANSARQWVLRLDESRDWILNSTRFETLEQQKATLDLYDSAEREFRRLIS
jgi:hypothetical protein